MSIQCSFKACDAVIEADTARQLTARLWHHLVGVHHPDLYAQLGFPVEQT